MSDLEDSFAVSWALLVPGHAPQCEYRIVAGDRHRWDFAWPESRVALEIQGGTWLSKNGKKAGHSTGTGQRRDCIKANLAAAAGWRVFYATSDMLRDDLPGLVAMILEAL